MPEVSANLATEPWKYPKLLYNVNVPPQMVNGPSEQKALGPQWRDFSDVAEAVTELRNAAPPPPDVPPVTLQPTSQSFTAAGGNSSFQVTVDGPGISGTWTVDKDAAADWLTVIAPTTPQEDDGVVNFAVAVNGDPAERTANLYVNGKTFAVTQAGTP